MSFIDVSLLKDREEFPSDVIEALEQEPVDYPAQFEFVVFLLSKRSKNVQQPGDLCAPGGGIYPCLVTGSG